jgi:hypothetical protein
MLYFGMDEFSLSDESRVSFIADTGRLKAVPLTTPASKLAGDPAQGIRTDVRNGMHCVNGLRNNVISPGYANECSPNSPSELTSNDPLP